MGAGGREIERALGSNFWELGISWKFSLFTVPAWPSYDLHTSSCRSRFTFLFRFFLGESNQWWACFEHKGWEKHNKKSGAGLCMAPQWLHLCGQVPVNRAEQSLSLSAWAFGQAPGWCEWPVSPHPRPVWACELFVPLDHHIQACPLGSSCCYLPGGECDSDKPTQQAGWIGRLNFPGA